MCQALFVAKENKFSGRTEYRSRKTGVTYSVGPDLSEFAVDEFTAEADGLIIIANSRREVLSLVELADQHTG